MNTQLVVPEPPMLSVAKRRAPGTCVVGRQGVAADHAARSLVSTTIFREL
jgi:hypothetical protein